jgi:hypothetical protein
VSNEKPKGLQKFEELERDIRKNRKQKDEVLDELERYYSWFLPLLSSIFVVAVGAGLTRSNDATSTPLFFFSAASLFLSLASAIASRFAIFQYHRLKRETVLPYQEWAVELTSSFGGLFRNVFPDQASLDEFAKTGELPPEDDPRRKYLSAHSDEFFRLISEGLAGAIRATALKVGLKVGAKPEELTSIQPELTKRMRRFAGLQSGPGAWALRLFYIAKGLFVIALLLLLVQLGINVFGADC